MKLEAIATRSKKLLVTKDDGQDLQKAGSCLRWSHAGGDVEETLGARGSVSSNDWSFERGLDISCMVLCGIASCFC